MMLVGSDKKKTSEIEIEIKAQLPSGVIIKHKINQHQTENLHFVSLVTM